MFSTWNRHRVLALSVALAATIALLFVSTWVASQPNYQAMWVWNQDVLTTGASRGEPFSLFFPDTPTSIATSNATPTPAPTSASTLPPTVTIASMLTTTEPIPISPDMSMQRHPALAYNSQDDEYLIVWWDNNIRGQITSVEESGSIIFVGQDFCISTATSGEERLAVAYNSTDNEYLVVWKDGRNFDVTNWDIYAQRVSADGELKGDNFSIADEIKEQFVPAVAYNSEHNEYLIVWADLREEVAREYDIYGQRLSGTGQPHGPNFIIASNEHWQAYPDVAYNSENNEYLVVWQEDQRNGSPDDIYGQRVQGGTGSLVESEPSP